MATTYKNVYFIGIGGIGMSAIARYFKFKGLNVSGYDKTESELTDTLQSKALTYTTRTTSTSSRKM